MRTVPVRRFIAGLLGVALALAPSLGAGPAFAGTVPPVEPAVVSVTLAPGTSLAVDKVVHTPAIPPRPDVIFLADTTGSMGAALSNVAAGASSIMSAVRTAQADSQFGAAEYKDGTSSFCPSDPFAYRLNQAVTADTTAAQSGINVWSAGGGCDTPESQLNALYTLATSSATGWRSGSTRIIAWFGDSSGHDPDLGHTLSQTIAALQAASIRVIAVPVVTGGDGLDATGQATAITSATGGVLLPAATPDQVASAILTGLQNLPTTVSWTLVACDSHLSVNLTPASQTVTSGSDAAFSETIAVAADAPQGTSITCTVQFLLDGKPADGFTESITIKVPDVTPPVAMCEPATNPSGNNIPSAGTNPKSGQNPDGFYRLTVTDNLPGALAFVADSGSTFVAGGYPDGTIIKLVQAPGATPGVKPGAGVVNWMINIKGDASVYAVDAAGNHSATVACLVPPPPK